MVSFTMFRALPLRLLVACSHKKPLSLLSSCAGTTFNVDGTTAEAAKFGYYIAKEQKSFSKLILNMLKTLDSTLKEEKRLNNNFRSGQLFYSIYCMHKLTIFVPLRKQWFSKKLPVERCHSGGEKRKQTSKAKS